LLPYVTLRLYDAETEARDTPLANRPEVYRQRDSRAYRDGDLFRVLVLYKYGGIYADMDTVLLRSLGVFLDQEFLYQWESFDDKYAPALLRLRAGGDFARALIDGLIEIPAGKYNWGRENMGRACRLGHRIAVFPSAFFNTEWQAIPRFEPFKKMPYSSEMYEGAFAWHWHNKWDDPIEPGSKFQLLEAQFDERLAGMDVCSR
jgi:Glycosyltransferase sugar-binding region containing DXD motif